MARLLTDMQGSLKMALHDTNLHTHGLWDANGGWQPLPMYCRHGMSAYCTCMARRLLEMHGSTAWQGSTQSRPLYESHAWGRLI